MKARGGSPYSPYELLGNDGMGMPPQGASDNWHRTPGKTGTKTGTSSWPPGERESVLVFVTGEMHHQLHQKRISYTKALMVFNFIPYMGDPVLDVSFIIQV